MPAVGPEVPMLTLETRINRVFLSCSTRRKIDDPFHPLAWAHDSLWSMFVAKSSVPRRIVDNAETAVARPAAPQPLDSEPKRTYSEDEPPHSDNQIAPAGSHRWLSKTFEHGNERYGFRVYVPTAYEGQPLPMIVMLHGAQQDPDDFASGTEMNIVAEENGFIVVYPEQPESSNPLRCWNWFMPANQTRESGEAAAVAALTREVAAMYNVDRARVYVAGMSAGGALAVILAVTHPELTRPPRFIRA